MRLTFSKYYGVSICICVSSATSTLANASQLASVCTTDEKTLSSIREDSDATLWTFIKSVCGDVRSASSHERPLPLTTCDLQRQTGAPSKITICSIVDRGLKRAEFESSFVPLEIEQDIEGDIQPCYQEEAENRSRRLLIIID